MSRPMRTELVSENGSRVVRLEIGDHHAHLCTSDVASLIENLVAIRAAMKPGVPGRISQQHQYSIEIDPCWYAEPLASPGGVVVFLRDTGLGWAGFSIDRDSARRLCDELSSYANRPIAPAGLPN
jgi:hypothetical protein